MIFKTFLLELVLLDWEGGVILANFHFMCYYYYFSDFFFLLVYAAF